MIRRPPRSTLDRSSAASDVYKRQVHALRWFESFTEPPYLSSPGSQTFMFPCCSLQRESSNLRPPAVQECTRPECAAAEHRSAKKVRDCTANLEVIGASFNRDISNVGTSKNLKH